MVFSMMTRRFARILDGFFRRKSSSLFLLRVGAESCADAVLPATEAVVAMVKVEIWSDDGR